MITPLIVEEEEEEEEEEEGIGFVPSAVIM
jgi:hypothetical protein